MKQDHVCTFVMEFQVAFGGENKRKPCDEGSLRRDGVRKASKSQGKQSP